MAQAVLLAEDVPKPEPDSIIVLRGATWADYHARPMTRAVREYRAALARGTSG